jgi:hypothetical protein
MWRALIVLGLVTAACAKVPMVSQMAVPPVTPPTAEGARTGSGAVHTTTPGSSPAESPPAGPPLVPKVQADPTTSATAESAAATSTAVPGQPTADQRWPMIWTERSLQTYDAMAMLFRKFSQQFHDEALRIKRDRGLLALTPRITGELSKPGQGGLLVHQPASENPSTSQVEIEPPEILGGGGKPQWVFCDPNPLLRAQPIGSVWNKNWTSYYWYKPDGSIEEFSGDKPLSLESVRVDCDHQKVTLPNGNEYDGRLTRDGAPNGRGRLTQADGVVYEGAFRDGVPRGAGVVTLPEGVVARGTFNGSILDADLVVTYPPKGQFIGMEQAGKVVGGKWQGKVVQRFPNGVRIEWVAKDSVLREGKFIASDGRELPWPPPSAPPIEVLIPPTFGGPSVPLSPPSIEGTITVNPPK